MDLFELKGKAALVTGAGRGIGKATADLFVAAGSRVARIDIEPGEGILVADVSDEAALERAIGEAVRTLGGLDVLVNNAGIAVRKTAFDITAEDWDRVLAVNLRGPPRFSFSPDRPHAASPASRCRWIPGISPDSLPR